MAKPKKKNNTTTATTTQNASTKKSGGRKVTTDPRLFESNPNGYDFVFTDKNGVKQRITTDQSQAGKTIDGIQCIYINPDTDTFKSFVGRAKEHIATQEKESDHNEEVDGSKMLWNPREGKGTLSIGTLQVEEEDSATRQAKKQAEQNKEVDRAVAEGQKKDPQQAQREHEERKRVEETLKVAKEHINSDPQKGISEEHFVNGKFVEEVIKPVKTSPTKKVAQGKPQETPRKKDMPQLPRLDRIEENQIPKAPKLDDNIEIPEEDITPEDVQIKDTEVVVDPMKYPTQDLAVKHAIPAQNTVSTSQPQSDLASRSQESMKGGYNLSEYPDETPIESVNPSPSLNGNAQSSATSSAQLASRSEQSSGGGTTLPDYPDEAPVAKVNPSPSLQGKVEGGSGSSLAERSQSSQSGGSGIPDYPDETPVKPVDQAYLNPLKRGGYVTDQIGKNPPLAKPKVVHEVPKIELPDYEEDDYDDDDEEFEGEILGTMASDKKNQPSMNQGQFLKDVNKKPADTNFNNVSAKSVSQTPRDITAPINVRLDQNIEVPETEVEIEPEEPLIEDEPLEVQKMTAPAPESAPAPAPAQAEPEEQIEDEVTPEPEKKVRSIATYGGDYQIVTFTDGTQKVLFKEEGLYKADHPGFHREEPTGEVTEEHKKYKVVVGKPVKQADGKETQHLLVVSPDSHLYSKANTELADKGLAAVSSGTDLHYEDKNGNWYDSKGNPIQRETDENNNDMAKNYRYKNGQLIDTGDETPKPMEGYVLTDRGYERIEDVEARARANQQTASGENQSSTTTTQTTGQGGEETTTTTSDQSGQTTTTTTTEQGNAQTSNQTGTPAQEQSPINNLVSPEGYRAANEQTTTTTTTTAEGAPSGQKPGETTTTQTGGQGGQTTTTTTTSTGEGTGAPASTGLSPEDELLKAVTEAKDKELGAFDEFVKSTASNYEQEKREMAAQELANKKASQFTGLAEIGAGIINLLSVGELRAEHQQYHPYSQDWMAQAERDIRDHRKRRADMSDTLAKLKFQKEQLEAGKIKDLAELKYKLEETKAQKLEHMEDNNWKRVLRDVQLAEWSKNGISVDKDYNVTYDPTKDEAWKQRTEEEAIRWIGLNRNGIFRRDDGTIYYDPTKDEAGIRQERMDKLNEAKLEYSGFKWNESKKKYEYHESDDKTRTTTPKEPKGDKYTVEIGGKPVTFTMSKESHDTSISESGPEFRKDLMALAGFDGDWDAFMARVANRKDEFHKYADIADALQNGGEDAQKLILQFYERNRDKMSNVNSRLAYNANAATVHGQGQNNNTSSSGDPVWDRLNQ